MNIKHHIEAGHYAPGPKLVPMRNGRIAVIYTTEHGGAWPIAGSVADDQYDNGRRLSCWQADGRISSSPQSGEDLMPPPPRKVVVKGYLLLRKGGGYAYWPNASEAARCAHSGDRLVELTGEYEEPWT